MLTGREASDLPESPGSNPAFEPLLHRTAKSLFSPRKHLGGEPGCRSPFEQGLTLVAIDQAVVYLEGKLDQFDIQERNANLNTASHARSIDLRKHFVHQVGMDIDHLSGGAGR